MTKRGGVRAYARVNGRIGAHLSPEELADELAQADPEISLTSFVGLELAGADAAGAMFGEVVFRDCLFDGVDFSRCLFADVLFTGCRFISCSMARAHLRRVDFRSSQALGLNLAESHLEGVSFDECQLRYADLSETAVRGLRARNASFAEGSWRSSTLRDVEFRDCDLTRLELAGTSLAGIDLSACAIGGFTLSKGLRELRGCIIAPEQAVDIVGHLGVRIAED